MEQRIWHTGDTVTAVEMNRIEQGIKDNETGIETLNESVETAKQDIETLDATKAEQSALNAESTAREAADTALSEKVDAIPDPLGAYVVESASGGVASFDDGAGGLPLKSCVVQIEPVQEGSGDPSPDNVRPIKGWTGCTLSHSGEDTSAPTTYPISWESEAGTVYGGTLTLREDATAELLVDRRFAVFDGSADEYWHKSSNARNAFWIRAGLDATDRKLLKNLCSQFQITTAGSEAYKTRYGYFVNDTSLGFSIDPDQAGTTVDSFRNWLREHPVQVVYATSRPIHLHFPVPQLRTLLGANNIWADTGDVSVEYRADPTILYNKLTNAILSTGGNV